MSNIIKDSLQLYLDAANINSYPGYGNWWYDLSGNNNDGTLSAETIGTTKSGVMTLNGSDTTISIPSPNLAASNFTVIGISKRTSGAGRMIAGGSNNWLLGHWSSYSECCFSNGWITPITGLANNVDTRIYAVTGNIAGDVYTFYDNTQNKTTAPSGGSAGPNGFLLGKYYAGAEYGTGEISVLLAYNEVLTYGEIVQIILELEYSMSAQYYKSNNTLALSNSLTLTHRPIKPTNAVLDLNMYELDSYNENILNVFPVPTNIKSWNGGTYGGTSCTISAELTTPSPANGTPLKMVPTAADASTQTWATSTWNLAPAVIGDIWTVSMWIKANGVMKAGVYIFEIDSSGTWLAGYATNTMIDTVTDTWVRFEATRTFTNASAAFIQIRFEGPDIYNAGDILWFDGCVVQKRSSASNFQDTRLLTQGWKSLNNHNLFGDITNMTTINDELVFVNASSDYIDITNNLLVKGGIKYMLGDGTNGVDQQFPYSIEAWFNFSTAPGALAAGMQLIGHNGAGGTGMQISSYTGTKMSFGYRGNATLFNNTALSGDTWYHGVCVHDPDLGNTIYLNANADGTLAASSLVVDYTTAQLKMGYTPSRLTQPYDGLMPIVRVYNKALTSLEVIKNFNNDTVKYFEEITSGSQYTLLLNKKTNTVFAWGINDGNFGDNTTTDRSTPIAAITNKSFKFITGSDLTSYGIDKSGQAWAWGSNSYGGIGDNSTISKNTPVMVCGGHIAKKIVAYNNAAILLDKWGRAWGWGYNTSGQLGNNSVMSYSTPVAVCGGHIFCNIALGPTATDNTHHALGIDEQGQAWAWGWNTTGPLGNNSIVDKSTPVAVYGGHTFCKISAGFAVSLGLDNNGQAWAWGFNGTGSLGNNSTTNYSTPIAVYGEHEFIDIATTELSGYGLDHNGKLWSWGLNELGTLGNNSTTNYSTPIAVYGDHTFCKITAGNFNAFGLDNNDQLWGWGDNLYGQLGIGNIISELTPVAVHFNNQDKAKYFIKFDAGYAPYNILSNTLTGSVFSWGFNDSGSLGDYSVISKITPVAVCGSHKFKYIAAGNASAYGIDYDGLAWAWGGNSEGQLGNNSVNNESTPVVVGGREHTFCKVYGAGTGVAMVDINGETWAWGLNDNGQLGDNTVTNQSTPVLILGKHLFKEVIVHMQHSLAIDFEGQAWGWGNNTYGQLGNNSTTHEKTPIAICGNHTFCHITPSVNGSSAIDNHGKAWTWGNNTIGQLGNNSVIDYSTPVAVCGNHTFCEISGGDSFNLALDNHGQAWGWGNNYKGVLGINSTVSYSTPVAVYGNHTFCHIKSDTNGGIAIDNNSQLWSWGHNDYGQLGDGTTSSRSTPVAVCISL